MRPMTPSPLQDLPAFREALAKWFSLNARDLPWRRTQDPYAIVVSEFMLQQTQVKTVIPYFKRWLVAFPSFAALAAAPEERVLSLWQGLGYYSRARSLHRLAQAVTALPAFPREVAAIRALPGIGPYTAGAISAFAYDAPVPAVDGNIARVLSRLFHLTEPQGSTAANTRLWELAAAILPTGDSGGRVQVGAIMELGAMLCLARKPLCLICPVHEFCAGRAALGQAVEDLPPRAIRPKAEAREQFALWQRDAAGNLLLQLAAGPLWKGLWHLPLMPTAPDSAELARHSFGITRYKVALRVFEGGGTDFIPFRLKGGHSISSVETRWFNAEEIAHLPMAAPHRKVIERLLSR